MAQKCTIYTRDKAADIVSLFEDALDRYDITVPSPEDDEKEPDNEARLYGSVYWNLVDDVEQALINILLCKDDETEIVTDVFS